MDPVPELPYRPAACEWPLIKAGHMSAPDYAPSSPKDSSCTEGGRPHMSRAIRQAPAHVREHVKLLGNVRKHDHGQAGQARKTARDAILHSFCGAPAIWTVAYLNSCMASRRGAFPKIGLGLPPPPKSLAAGRAIPPRKFIIKIHRYVSIAEI
jgi:hypothetical protein